MVESYGKPGESQETRVNPGVDAPTAPYVKMLGDRPQPHYVCQTVDGGGVWVEPPPPVPEEITTRQGKHELIDMGLYNEAEALIAAIPDDKERAKAQVSWNNHIWHIEDPLIQALWMALGKSDGELEDAFRRAKLR